MAVPVTGKQAGELESVAAKIQESAAALAASGQTAVSQVGSTRWEGEAAKMARAVAADLDTAMTRHVAKMRSVADRVSASSKRLDAGDAAAGQEVAKVHKELGGLGLA